MSSIMNSFSFEMYECWYLFVYQTIGRSFRYIVHIVGNILFTFIFDTCIDEVTLCVNIKCVVSLDRGTWWLAQVWQSMGEGTTWIHYSHKLLRPSWTRRKWSSLGRHAGILMVFFTVTCGSTRRYSYGLFYCYLWVDTQVCLWSFLLLLVGRALYVRTQ